MMSEVHARGGAGGNEREARPSREEIERLCLAYALEAGGCTVGDLAERLGLARELGTAVEHAIAPLVAEGHLAVNDHGVSLSRSGGDWLQRRLTALGCQ